MTYDVVNTTSCSASEFNSEREREMYKKLLSDKLQYVRKGVMNVS